MQQYNWST